MNKHKILLIGGGGHCESCIEVIESTEIYEIAGIIDAKDKVGESVLGYQIIGTDDDLKILFEDYKYALITVGQINSSIIRERIYKKLKKIGFTLPEIVASSAYVSPKAEIGAGSIIMHNAFVNAKSIIGVNCIVNTKALVEHGVVIGNNNHISTGVILNGECSVGDRCFVGSGTVFNHGVSIESDIVIGSGSLVRKNISNKGVYSGNPLKKYK